MQLDKLVTYHRALADPTRIRLLLLLKTKERSGQELAAELSVSAPTITHHIKILREATLIKERREKNTIFFSLNTKVVQQKNQAIQDLLLREKKGDEEMPEIMNQNEKLKLSVLENFFTKEGTLKQIPAQLKKKLIVLEKLMEELERGKKYSEQELNQYIKQYHPDFATIRREFIMQQYMYRENGIYEVNPREMWAKWQDL